jgi:hypothetical protein
MILTGPYRLLSESRDFVRDQCIVSAFSRRVGGVPALGTPLFPITPSYRKDDKIEASRCEGRLMLVRVGNIYGIFQRINTLFMAFEVPHGCGFDIHAICPCLSTC